MIFPLPKQFHKFRSVLKSKTIKKKYDRANVGIAVVISVLGTKH